MASHAGAEGWKASVTGSQSWNNGANWDEGTFPNAPGAAANIGVDIAAGLTINLNQGITVGSMTLGDSNPAGASNGTAINSGSGTNTLVFEGATPGAATSLSISAASFSNNFTSNSINANLRLGGTSSLTISMTGTAANAQPLVIGGQLDVNGNTLTMAGAGTGTMTINGVITGAGTIVKNSAQQLIIGNNANTFSGSIVANNGQILVVSGSLNGANSMTLNGNAFSGNTYVGGNVALGINVPTGTNPGQRLPSSTIIFNSARLIDSGQPLNGGAAGTVVSDSVATMRFKSGFNVIDISTGGGSGGTTLNVATFVRDAGSTLSVRGTSFGGTNKVLVGNASSFLVGGAGAAGTTTMSIIPWATARIDSNGGTRDMATYDTTVGIRPLTSSEYYTGTFSAAPTDANVKSGGFASLTANQTVNSLFFNSFSTTDMGAGRRLTITSGALMFENSSTAIGTSGGANAGTLAFGSAEAVVWSAGTNTNTIGAVIDGTGGFIKSGSGTLTLTGVNTYTGKSAIAGGTLRVGNGGANVSKLGSSSTSDVFVADGALLRLSSADAINDAATLELSHAGIFYGKIQLDMVANEVVGSLVLGGVQMGAGVYAASSGVGVTYVDSNYFAGSGKLEVIPVPEPSAFSLLAGCGLMLKRRRRR